MSIRSDIKLLENINTTLLIAEKIQTVEKQYNLSNNTSVDIDYQAVLEMVSIYKDILQNKPFVKVASKNMNENTHSEFFNHFSTYSSEVTLEKLNSLKKDIVADYSELANSIEKQYKKSGPVITKYGYDNRQPLLPQIKTRINSFLSPTSLISSDFDTSKITSVRQGFNNFDNNALKYKS